MLSDIKRRLDREDEGFTLIELMVVVLIIAILLAIAIPTFLGARNQANSRAVESTLRNALTAEQTYWTNNQTFGDTTTSPTINSIEPNITWATAAADKTPNQVGVYMDTAKDMVWLQAGGNDGNCYTLFQDNSSSASTATTGYSIASGTCTAPTTTSAATVNSGAAVSGGGFYSSW